MISFDRGDWAPRGMRFFCYLDRLSSKVTSMLLDITTGIWMTLCFHSVQIVFKACCLFLSFKPAYHLWKLVPAIGCSPAFLGKVDVQTFEHLRIVVVRRAKLFDRGDVVEKRVEFRYIEIIPYSQCNKYLAILMKEFQSFFHVFQHVIIMSHVLSQVNEVQDATGSTHHPTRHFTHQASQKYLCNGLAFSPRDLRQPRNPILEVSNSK